MTSRLLRDPATGRLRRNATSGRVLRALAGGAGGECACCGGVPDGCVCGNDASITLPPCCCLPTDDPDYCGDDAHLCSDICDEGAQPDCPCPGNSGILRPSCCCLPVSDPDSCAGNGALCAMPCYPSSPCGGTCTSFTCDDGQCCYNKNISWTVGGSLRFKNCECSGGRVSDITATGTATYIGNTKISQSGSATIIYQRFFGSGYVTTCTIAGFLAAGGNFGGCTGANFIVTLPSRSACPSCYTNGPNPSAGTCATEGFPTFSTATITTGCGNDSGAEQLSCQDTCAGSSGVFNEGVYSSGCRHSAYESNGSGQCFPGCNGFMFTEIKKCAVYVTGGSCAAGASMGAAMSSGYEMLESGLLAPNRAMVKAARTDACPLCGKAGWDGVWRNIEGLRGERAMRGSPSRNARKATGTHCAGAHRSEAKSPAAAEKNRDRGLGDTVARVIKATTGIEATEGCGCAKRKDLLNRLVPYGRKDHTR